MGQQWGNVRHGSQANSPRRRHHLIAHRAEPQRTPTHPTELAVETYGTEGQRFESSRAR